MKREQNQLDQLAIERADLIVRNEQLNRSLKQIGKADRNLLMLIARVNDFIADVQDFFPDEPLFSDDDNEAFVSLVKLRQMMKQIQPQQGQAE